MTVTHQAKDLNVSWTKHWGCDRVVEIQRGPRKNLGFSIVGGKVDLHNGEVSSDVQKTSGVFIKSVAPDIYITSPNVQLKIGDRIVELDGENVQHLTCERVAELIQRAGSSIRLRVQSLTDKEDANYNDISQPKPKPQQSIKRRDSAQLEKQASTQSVGEKKKVPLLKQLSKQLSIERQKSIDENKEKPSESESSEDEEDEQYLQGNIYTKGGKEISRRSAGNVKRTPAEVKADPEEEDEFGYTAQKIQKKYRALGGQILMEKIDKTAGELGIAIAGHKDRLKMAVFICGLNPKGIAHKSGKFKIGDEILEINGKVFQGRSHLNASATIRNTEGPTLKLIIRRVSSENNDLAVKPLTHFPAAIDESDRYSNFEGVRTVAIKKGLYGLGIMIVEGKHAEVGQGIFISDIQEGSVAEQGGLHVGDMILGVNTDTLLGVSHDQATAILKRTEGIVTITVCNPNQGKKEEPKIAASAIGAKASPAKAAQSPKPGASKTPESAAPAPAVTPSKGKPISTEVTKSKDNALGLVITGGSDTSSGGVFILDIYSDGLIGKNDKLKLGDQITEFAQENFKSIERERAEATVYSANGAIKITVLRDEHTVQEVEVELHKKPGKGTGLCLIGFKNGKGAYISELMVGGSALECGKLEVGDQIVSVAGQNVQEMSTDDIASLMKFVNPVPLKVMRYKAKASV